MDLDESLLHESEFEQTAIGPDCMLFKIGTRFPESPIPSRVLIAIGPGAPPRGQLQGAYRTGLVTWG